MTYRVSKFLGLFTEMIAIKAVFQLGVFHTHVHVRTEILPKF